MPGQNAHAEQETKGHGQRLDPALAQWRFRDVLEDRPYLICRGVRDTAMFRIQSARNDAVDSRALG
jgi:hypothetical protein